MSEVGDDMGSLATGSPATPDSSNPICANCGTLRVGELCHMCGQAGHVHKNVSAIIHDIAHGVFHLEGRVWHTLPLLAWQPGRLTRRYIDGERAKFVSPIALFLFSVFLMFAVVSNIGNSSHKRSASMAAIIAQQNGQLAELKVKRAKAAKAVERRQLDDRIDATNDRIKALREAVRTGESSAIGKTGDRQPVHLKTGWAWVDDGAAHMSANPDLTVYKVKTYAYKYGWALIPISLPFIWLLFAFRRDVGLYDHAIFSIYSLSFMSLGVVVLTLLGTIGIPSALIALAAIFIPPIHMYRQLKGTYGLGRFGATWRTAALLIVTAITSILFTAFLLYMGST